MEILGKLCSEAEQNCLLALSGGADSMVLADLFLAASKAYPPLKFQAAHVNFGLRGKDSDADQKVVKDFCVRNNIPLHVRVVQEHEKPKNSVQLWARDLRYHFFFKILKQENLKFLVTAHHADDNAETFFINLSRGSGLRGLSGIPASENNILRPLLDFSKRQIYDYALHYDVAYREDASNSKNDYLRNRFRNSVLPSIENEVSGFKEGLKTSMSHLKNAADYIQCETERYFQEIIIQQNDSETLLDRAKLLALHPFLATEILLKFGVRGDEFQKVTQAEGGKMFRTKSHEIFITRGGLLCRVRRAIKS